MKKTFTLRTQLILLMALIVLLQSVALVMALSLSRVYFMLDAEAYRLFGNTTEARSASINRSIGQLVGDMAKRTEAINADLAAVASSYDIFPSEFYLNNKAYEAACVEGTKTLIALLRDNNVTGAFFILNGSNSNKSSQMAHSTVHIHNTTPGIPAENNKNLLLELGPTAVSKAYQITTGIHWDLDMQFQADANTDYYHKPIWASRQTPNVEMERYGYWGRPMNFVGDRQHMVSYTMPLLDAAGNAYGVLGVEMTLSHFTQIYLPGDELLYRNSFYAVGTLENETLSAEGFLPGGALAQVYLQEKLPVVLNKVRGESLYEVTLDGLGEMYCATRPIKVYSDNSPFAGETWNLLCFVPQNVIHEGSASVRQQLAASIVATSLVSFGAIFVLVYLSTRKISGLSQHLQSLSPYDQISFKRTGMQEIDELTSAVEKLNQRVMNASKTTSRILDLTLLPIGGFEVPEEDRNVVLTGFIYRLLRLDQGKQVTRSEWRDYYRMLKRRPIDEHDNVYQYYDEVSGENLWLRIVETRTGTETLGVILDVTRDIEENRRLAFELDHDGLTNLYNRNAFKREVNSRIKVEQDKIGIMIFSDLDNLKYMNDNYGHEMGDKLIISASEIFREFSRHGGIVSRISGDEFAIYLHGFGTREEARELIAEGLSRRREQTVETPDGKSCPVRFSSGYAWYPEDSDNVTDLLKLSDFAMYEAKHKEKGSVVEFNRQSYQENAYLLENREVIGRLLDEELIRFAYQPIVNLKTGEIFGYEALMRPLISNFKTPREVLNVVAAQSKLGQLERMVVFMAFQIASDSADALKERKLFLNSIPSHAITQEDMNLLRRSYQKAFRSVVMEMTGGEDGSTKDLGAYLEFLRNHGIAIAFDRFGQGQFSGPRLLAMEPDIIKVDMELIQGIHESPDKRKLVSGLVEACHKKGIALIAEGVENAQELACVMELGLDYAQGYFLGRPDYQFKEVSHLAREQIRKTCKR